MTTKPVILLSGQDRRGTAQSDCDCDCACVDATADLHDLAAAPGAFLSIPALYQQPLTGEYRLVFNPQTNTEIAVLNQPALAVLESFGSPRPVGPGEDVQLIHQMVKAGLLDRSGEERQALPASVSPTLSAWLHLTDRCNLRCSYCYLPHIRETMSAGIGRAAVDAVFRSAAIHGYQKVKLKYAGGEPLLCFPLILHLHAHAARLAETNGLAVEEVILSNGTLLTERMADLLGTLGIRLMISMDGMGSHHDSQRPYAGGRGSFQDVSRAIEMALERGLVPTISVTVSSLTVKGLPALLEWILERELPFSLNFYRENDLSASAGDLKLEEGIVIDGMRAALKTIENHLPRKPFLSAIMDRAHFSSPHTLACGAGQNYLVFDPAGRVAKCQMHIRRPITDLEATDPLTVLRMDQTGIQNISVEEKEGCRVCAWKGWCAGGCPLAAYRVTGRYDVSSPYCRIYKALFPEALRLEGLRLLSEQDDPDRPAV